jgi:hypothetical protein
MLCNNLHEAKRNAIALDQKILMLKNQTFQMKNLCGIIF